MSGGDLEKAVVFYQVRLKERPLCLLMFGGGIKNYRELYKQLIDRIKKD